METVIISESELYPYYDLEELEKYGEVAHVSHEQAKRYKRVLQEFAEIQKELGVLYEDAQSKRILQGKYTRAEAHLRS